MRIPKTFSYLFNFFVFVLFLALSSVAATAGTDDCRKSVSGNARPVVEGAELPSTNGIYFNARDELFVTSVVGRSITQLNPHTGRSIVRLGPEQGVESPDDLIFDKAGNLYWTAFLTGEVARLTPAGDKTTIANLGRGVNAITLSTDETKLYVSRLFLADEVWEIDLSGANPPRLLAQDLGGFNGMDIGPDGRLYGPLWYHGQVAVIDTTSGTVEIVADGLGTPSAVKFNHSGELFVVDQSRGQVFRIDIETGKREWVANVGIGADNLAFDSHDQLFVTNTHDSAIRHVARIPHEANCKGRHSRDYPYRKIGRGCKHLRVDSSPDRRPARAITCGGLTTASGIALHQADGHTSLFVADIYSIHEFAPVSGRPRSVAHSIVGGVSDLNTPFSLSSYASYLLSTSWFANVVQIWNPELQEVVDEYRDFAVPLNAIGFADGLAVAELGSGCVMRQPADNSDRPALGCDFKVPAGLAQYDGKLFVSDWATGSVWQIARNYKKVEPPILVTSGLQQPEGMAATGKGTLLVVETGMDRILEIDLSSGATRTFADELQLGNSGTPGYPPTWIFNSVAVDDCGAVYINMDGDRSVRRIADDTALHCKP